MSPRRTPLGGVVLAAAALSAAGCDAPVSVGEDPFLPLELRVENLPPLDPAEEGEYEAWVIVDGDIRSAGRFPGGGGEGRPVRLRSPLPAPVDVMVTLEPPGDADDRPSMLKIMGGRVHGGRAELRVDRYLTAGIPLEPDPGRFVLATPSNDDPGGGPSVEDAGLWLVGDATLPEPGDSLPSGQYVTLTPLTRGWIYEGWIVRDLGTPEAIWLSYGKFEPDPLRRARARDNSGLGPFSAVTDYRRALPRRISVPGDDWLANPLGLPLPASLGLPLDLNGDAARGIPSRWTNVITIEPWAERDEDPWTAAPFFLRPYRGDVGEAPSGSPRALGFHPGSLPRGTAQLGS